MMFLLWVVSGLGFWPVQDTVTLAEVEVYAPALERYTRGQKILVFDKKDLESYAARSLGDLLQEKSPVFVRQYGAGMLASPSFRGTSAGHTAVFWNGLPVNSPSLGQSDLSILPLEAVDEVQVQFGSAGALIGNEAIGGSVHLGSKTAFGKGFTGKINQAFGSFGTWNMGLSGGYSWKNVSVHSKFYRQFSKNIFPYQDLAQAGLPVVKEDHAQVEQLGWVQDFAWNLTEKSQLKASFWWNQAEREIQPVMGSNTQDVQTDQSLRAVLDYFRFGAAAIWNLKIGWVQDELVFNETENRTRQAFLATDWDRDIGSHWSLKFGARGTFAKGELSTYTRTDERLELYQDLKWSPLEQFSIGLNFRQMAYSDQLEPFLPGIGMDWNFLELGESHFLLKASAGKGFKVPTLNDRFWVPGGNPDLLPERSVNGEFGLHWNRESKITWVQSLTYYRMNVDNWIIWMPQGSVWSPENIREVKSQGLEYQGKTSWTWATWNWDLSLSYTFSESLDLTSEPGISRQLPYTPKHQANGGLSANKAGFSIQLDTYRVGERSIGTGSARILEAYQLWNAGISYQNLQWGKVKFPLRFQVFNLMGKNYQVLYLRAMPGRSYQLNLTINI